jgi:hypothetical protein
MRRELEGAGEYTSVAVEALCDALTKPACMLKDLRIFGNCWGNKDAHKLAMAIASRNQWPSAAPLDMLDMRWNEMGSDAIEAMLAAATDACTVEHMPQRLRCGATLNAHTNWGETLHYHSSSLRAPRYHSGDARCQRNRPNSTKQSRTASFGAWTFSCSSCLKRAPRRPCAVCNRSRRFRRFLMIASAVSI